MKTRIDKSGTLEIERAGKWKLQDCRCIESMMCGDWCPLFDETVDDDDDDDRVVRLYCSGGGWPLVHRITSDARPKAGGA